MYHTVYIDVFFLENLLTDYLVLTLVNRSLKLGSGRLRRLTGACVGSLGLCLLYLFPGKGIPWIVRFFGALVFYLGLSSLMIRCGLRIPGRSLFGKALFLLYFVSFLLGGVFRWLQEAVEVPVFPFLFFSLVSYGILKLGLKGILRVRTGQQSICQVTLGFHGNTLELRGLLDTGNQLQDPVTGEAVHILEQAAGERLWGGETVLLRPVPYHSVGKPTGLLPVFRADSMSVRLADREEHRERPLIGITKEPLSSGNEYEMILHSELSHRDRPGG